MSFPSNVGMVLPAGASRPVASWLIQGVVHDRGLSAFAAVDSRVRSAFGVSVVRALLDPASYRGGLCGHAIRAQVGSALIFAAPGTVAWRWREALAESAVTVVAARLWDAADDTYWPALHEQAADYDLVVIDTVQNLTAVPATSVVDQISRGLAGFEDRPVLALYKGNATTAGVGAEGLWGEAEVRHYQNPKTELVEAVGENQVPWPLTINVQEVLAPRASTTPIDDEAAKVRKTAFLALAHGADPDAGRSLGSLLLKDEAGLAAIWGTATRTVILPALGRHKNTWDATLAGQQATLTDEPPF